MFNQKRDTHQVYTNLHTIWWQPKTNKESPVKNIHIFIWLSRLKQKHEHVHIRLSVNSRTDLDTKNRCQDTPAWPLTPCGIYLSAEDKKDCDQGTVYLQKTETLFDTVGISDTLHALVTMFKISILLHVSGSKILNLYNCKYVLYFENCSILTRLQSLPFFCVYNENVKVICTLELTALWI